MYLIVNCLGDRKVWIFFFLSTFAYFPHFNISSVVDKSPQIARRVHENAYKGRESDVRVRVQVEALTELSETVRVLVKSRKGLVQYVRELFKAYDRVY